MREKPFSNLYKSLRIGIVLGIIGLIIGALLTAFVIYTKKQMDSQTTAIGIYWRTSTNEDGNTTYAPVLTYKVNEQIYSCTSSSYSTVKTNSNPTVYYNSTDPTNCFLEDMYWITYVFFIFPLAFILVPVFQFASIRRKINKIHRLARYGQLIRNLPYTLIYSSVHRFKCISVKYTLKDGSVINLVDNPLWDRETPVDENGFVDLLIDPNNPKNYYLDFEIDLTALSSDPFNNPPPQEPPTLGTRPPIVS